MIRFVPRQPLPDDGSKDVSPLTNQPGWFDDLLRLRGVTTPEEADAFLHPSLDQLHDPFEMKDMEKAVSIIREAVDQGDKIMVYGDYDCDGTCAAAILTETLRTMGGKADFYLPSRHQEGYGLNTNAIREIAETHQLLISVDCGITNVGEVQRAQELGLKVIVTDHHQLGRELPEADAVLNPLRGDYPFRTLCGAGVALKVCQALRGVEGVRDIIDLAAIATVADLVPLTGENRIIVAEGLRRMKDAPRPFLQAFAAQYGWKDDYSSARLAFQIAPRINAAGRLGDARRAVDMMLAQDAQKAADLALELDTNNQERKNLEQQVIQEARSKMGDHCREDRLILVMGEGWNSGVIGLAAGRLCERHHLPTVVLAKTGDTAVGSCRSIPGINIHALLTQCGDLFRKFGGHEMAAGMTMDADKVETLRTRLVEQMAEKDPACFEKNMVYDVPLPLSELTFDLLDQLKLLEPTGFGNPAPVFLLSDAEPLSPRRIGKDGSHLMMQLRQRESIQGATAFSMGDQAEQLPPRMDCLFVPEQNEFNGKVSIRVQVKAIQPHGAETAAAEKDDPPAAGDGRWILPLLEEFSWLMSNSDTFLPADKAGWKSDLPVSRPGSLEKWIQETDSMLLIAHHPDTVADFRQKYPNIPVCSGAAGKAVGTVLLTQPELSGLQPGWKRVVLLDGDVIPGEAHAICSRCPRAKISAMQPNDALNQQLTGLALRIQEMRTLYRGLEQSPPSSMEVWCSQTGHPPHVLWTVLYTFRQARFLDFAAHPLKIQWLTPTKQELDDLPIRQYLNRYFP